ncbi:hypothetical protein SKC37_08150 [Aquirufa sp. HETE-83D]|uniref:O-antigen ligase domain-containing protein n=1 Tax=Aquirufa esocilacus TaxID=3096513 RepID=A0ABW6DSG3_9BACT
MNNWLYRLMNLFFFGLVFILTRQIPFSSFSLLMNISLVGVFLSYFCLYKIRVAALSLLDEFLVFFIFILILHLGYSVLLQSNKLEYSVRFFIIILSILLAYYLNKIPIRSLYYFVAIVLLQALFVIFVEIICLFFDNGENVAILQSIVKFYEWGSIYSNGTFYHIQIKGNALLPFTYMVVTIVWVNKRLLRIIFLISTIFAGNFAFLISIFFFHTLLFLLNLKKNYKSYLKIFVVFLLLIVLSSTIIGFVIEKINSKLDDSIFERFEQKKYLLDHLTNNPFSILFGNGLGTTLNVQSYTRDYRDSIYFEIQPLYFLDQMGVILFSFFILLNIGFVYRNYKNYSLLVIYVSYILYSFSNPYILDTNHIVVIMVLNIIQYNYLSKCNKWKFTH